MEENRIQQQIAIYMTNKKLVEFNDKLKLAPVEFYAHIHAQGEKVGDNRQRSCVGVVWCVGCVGVIDVYKCR